MYLTFCFFSFFIVIKICGEEFCISELFHPSCMNDQIIVIKNAFYGRKKFGKCLSIEEEPDEAFMENLKIKKGFIGCYSNVKLIIEPKCA